MQRAKAGRNVLQILLVIFAIYTLPVPRILKTTEQNSVRVLDRNGKILYETGGKGQGIKQNISLDSVPENIIHALIASEDRTFASHRGISARGIVRAFMQNVHEGRIISGGSTITQQLVRNRIQPKQRGYVYKALEALMAIKLERELSKEKILELYLNTAYFGHQAYGIRAAAMTYLGKEPNELSLAESSLLIGLVQSPSQYDPFRNLPSALRRQKSVLQAMLETGFIKKNDYDDTLSESIHLAQDTTSITAPHFALWVIMKKRDDMGEVEEDIHTTLDLSLQSEVEDIIGNQLKKLKEKNVTSAAVIVLDAHTGEILSMVGSADYFDKAHDGAVNSALAKRQPGSALKPFTYALALQKGETAATTVADVETQFSTQNGNPYTPRNYDYDEHGLVRYRVALANSYNIAAVKVLQKVGIETLLRFLRDAGITSLNESPEHYGLALTLGDGEVTLLELTKAYGIFAREGKTLPIRIFKEGNTESPKQILDPSVSWLIADILSDKYARLPEFGENGPLNFDFPVAVKTGTTRNSRDNWTIGFTPDVIVGVWVGNADNSPMRDTSGVTGAGPIFHDVMLAATNNKPHTWFATPKNIVQEEICKLSGALPTRECTERMEEKFISGTEPTKQDEMYKTVAIDRRNGLLASSQCPSDVMEYQVRIVFPPELWTWARRTNEPIMPKQISPLCDSHEKYNKEDAAWIHILKPHDGDSFLIDPLIPLSNQKIILEAQTNDTSGSIEWSMDGKELHRGSAPNDTVYWTPEMGKHEITAKSKAMSTTITIEIKQENK